VLVAWVSLVALAGSDGPRRGGLFASADGDRDGIPDRHDACRVAEEVWNGYADDDGCPDHLAALDVLPMVGEIAVAATVTLARRDRIDEAEAPRVADDLVPGQRVALDVQNGCLRGGAELLVQQGRNVVEVELEPQLDRPVEWTVTDPDGALVRDVVLRFDSACAPLTPRRLADGTGTVLVGVGRHPVTIEAPGFEAASLTVDGDDESVRITLELPAGDEVEETETETETETG